jgi:hypothetical protein
MTTQLLESPLSRIRESRFYLILPTKTWRLAIKLAKQNGKSFRAWVIESVDEKNARELGRVDGWTDRK